MRSVRSEIQRSWVPPLTYRNLDNGICCPLNTVCDPEYEANGAVAARCRLAPNLIPAFAAGQGGSDEAAASSTAVMPTTVIEGSSIAPSILTSTTSFTEVSSQTSQVLSSSGDSAVTSASTPTIAALNTSRTSASSPAQNMTSSAVPVTSVGLDRSLNSSQTTVTSTPTPTAITGGTASISGLSGGVIIGVAIGGAAAVVAFAAVIWW